MAASGRGGEFTQPRTRNLYQPCTYKGVMNVLERLQVPNVADTNNYYLEFRAQVLHSYIGFVNLVNHATFQSNIMNGRATRRFMRSVRKRGDTEIDLEELLSYLMLIWCRRVGLMVMTTQATIPSLFLLCVKMP